MMPLFGTISSKKHDEQLYLKNRKLKCLWNTDNCLWKTNTGKVNVFNTLLIKMSLNTDNSLCNTHTISGKLAILVSIVGFIWTWLNIVIICAGKPFNKWAGERFDVAGLRSVAQIEIEIAGFRRRADSVAGGGSWGIPANTNATLDRHHQRGSRLRCCQLTGLHLALYPVYWLGSSTALVPCFCSCSLIQAFIFLYSLSHCFILCQSDVRGLYSLLGFEKGSWAGICRCWHSCTTLLWMIWHMRTRSRLRCGRTGRSEAVMDPCLVLWTLASSLWQQTSCFIWAWCTHNDWKFKV